MRLSQLESLNFSTLSIHTENVRIIKLLNLTLLALYSYSEFVQTLLSATAPSTPLLN